MGEIGFIKSNNVDTPAMRSTCDVPQWTIWWYEFPEPIGRHMALVVSNNNFNMQRVGVMVLVVTSKTEKSMRFPYNKLLSINGKYHAVNLDTMTYVRKSELKITDYVGMVVDQNVVKDILSGIGNMFDPTYTVDESQYVSDVTDNGINMSICKTHTTSNSVIVNVPEEPVKKVAKVVQLKPETKVHVTTTATPQIQKRCHRITKFYIDFSEVMSELSDDDILDICQYTGWDYSITKYRDMTANRLLKLLAAIVKLGTKDLSDIVGCQQNTITFAKKAIINELDTRGYTSDIKHELSEIKKEFVG